MKRTLLCGLLMAAIGMWMPNDSHAETRIALAVQEPAKAVNASGRYADLEGMLEEKTFGWSGGPLFLNMRAVRAITHVSGPRVEMDEPKAEISRMAAWTEALLRVNLGEDRSLFDEFSIDPRTVVGAVVDHTDALNDQLAAADRRTTLARAGKPREGPVGTWHHDKPPLMGIFSIAEVPFPGSVPAKTNAFGWNAAIERFSKDKYP